MSDQQPDPSDFFPEDLDPLLQAVEAEVVEALDEDLLRVPKHLEANEGWVAGLALWLRAVESCEATLTLVQQGTPGAAWATLRTAFECLFYACALWNKPENYKKLSDTHHHERLLQIQEMLKHKSLEGVSPETLARWTASGESPKSYGKWSSYEAADDAKLMNYYQLMYRGCSLAGAHGTERSLETHLNVEADGSVSLKYRRNFEHARLQLSWTREVLSQGLVALRKHHKIILVK